MGVGVAVDYASRELSAASWSMLSVPPAADPLIASLNGLNTLWEYELTLCTFILTFFTSQAYAHWRSVYFTTRAIQGRVNDVCLLLAVSAQRGGSGYSEDASRLLQRCTRLIRVSHTFFWAATPTCSNGVGDGGVELSKSFLDPFGNEGYPGQNIRVDVLVSELNFGSGSRWTKAGALLPDSH